MELFARIKAQSICSSELTDDERAALLAAMNVRRHAQAPYSNFMVGAAVVSSSGVTHVGCNVERCSYTQTTHAEQNAIDCMVAAEGPARIALVAIVAAPASVVFNQLPEFPPNQITMDIRNVCVPCGHCLQIIWENCLGHADTPLVSMTASGEIFVTTIGDAFPMRFGPDTLGVDISAKR
jgi:cytidine deaminase